MIAPWCRWCGKDLPKTRRELGDFCGPACSHEYHRDLGGYAWALDLMQMTSNRGHEPDEPKG